MKPSEAAIERGAKAARNVHFPNGTQNWPDLPDVVKKLWRDMALAAWNAMQEPQEAVMEAQDKELVERALGPVTDDEFDLYSAVYSSGLWACNRKNVDRLLASRLKRLNTPPAPTLEQILQGVANGSKPIGDAAREIQNLK